MRPLDITSKDKILIVAPHPDDECIGPGGILLQYPELCDVIVLTDGRQGQGDTPPVKEKEIRKQEFIEEMRFLGIKNYKMLDIKDGTLLSHTDCLMDSSLQDYSKVFVTGIQDEHPDHKAAFLSVVESVTKISSNSIPECFVYEVHTPIQMPTHFFDISGLLQKKSALIRMHKSQLRELPYDVLAEQSAGYRATLFRMPGKKIEVYEEININTNLTNEVSETEMLLQKERLNGWVLKRWICRLLDGILFSDELNVNGVNKVYVYGYGELGKILIKELVKEGIEVRAVFDRRAEQFENEDIGVMYVEDAEERLPVIVTSVYEYEDIEKKLKELGFDLIYSLRGLLESI